MDDLSVPVTISALAAAIADGRSSEELAVLAAVFTQLGDTLTTIASVRDAREACRTLPPAQA